MTSSPEELTKKSDKSFSERVMDPLLARTQKLGRRITGADQAERIRAQLDRAGNPKGWTVDRVSSAQILGNIGGLSAAAYFFRSEERRVGQEGVSTCRYRWSPDYEKIYSLCHARLNSRFIIIH